MDDPKIKELRLIHKDLATYLSKQRKILNNSLLAVAALRMTVENYPIQRRLYRTNLRDIAKGGIFLTDLDYANTLESLLKRLKEW
jgi:hypothetical protein